MKWSSGNAVLDASVARWITGVVTIIVAVGSSHPLAQATPSETTKYSAQLTLTNPAWDSVRVEVRSGVEDDCSSNALVGILWLKRDRVWAIRSDVPVCWRREQTPGAGDDLWAAWRRRVLGSDEQRTDPLDGTD
jgi:hypothetical protein